MRQTFLRLGTHAAMLTAALALAGCGSDAVRGEETAVVTAAPNVPPPITRNHRREAR